MPRLVPRDYLPGILGILAVVLDGRLVLVRMTDPSICPPPSPILYTQSHGPYQVALTLNLNGSIRLPCHISIEWIRLGHG